jgi:hypothetical protein
MSSELLVIKEFYPKGGALEGAEKVLSTLSSCKIQLQHLPKI